ncbi:MAG: TetR/AcrR family transcriptional regulator [Thermomicrobium sp.]|nr:TetR/AcrR family transcriptional regulator [Thermomicrobium sp.]MDW8059138.1 TetR/AcrR family transcriptional regulator [Thermomicrobium sp.]
MASATDPRTSEPVVQARARARRERILDAALQVFARRGYRDATMDEVADAAATSKGGLYFHFPGKEALFLALLERSAELLLRRTAEALASASDPASKLDAALDVVLRLFATHRPLARLFLVEAMAAGPAIQGALVELRRRFAALIAGELAAARAAGLIGPLDPDLAATACFGALYEVVTQWVLTGNPPDLEQAAPELRRLLRRMLGLPEPAEGNRTTR